MSTVGIYDADFFSRPGQIPNLECMKLYTRECGNRNITALTPITDTSMYTKYYVRKDIRDDNFPPFFFNDNVDYGGLAFSLTQMPLDESLVYKKVFPEIYAKYSKYYGRDEAFKKLLKSAHLRISNDGRTLLDESYLMSQIDKKDYAVVLHDLNILEVNGYADFLKEIQSRTYSTGAAHPYNILLKFPVRIKSLKQLEEWAQLSIHRCNSTLIIEGPISNEEFVAMSDYFYLSKNLVYMPAKHAESEEKFMRENLVDTFYQCCYLREIFPNYSLISDAPFVPTVQFANMFLLFNEWTHSKNYNYCDQVIVLSLRDWCRKKYTWQGYEFQNSKTALTRDQSVEVFNYIKSMNPEALDTVLNRFKIYRVGGTLQ